MNAQDEYILELYTGKRPPKGMMVFNTSNQDSLEKEWKKMLERARENPHLPAILAVENRGQAQPKKIVEFIDYRLSVNPHVQYGEKEKQLLVINSERA